MRGSSMAAMAYEDTPFQPSSQLIKSKENSFISNNSNEPISVLDTRRSPSPSTSTSTLSGNTLHQKWPESLPGAAVDGSRKDDWPDLQPIPADFELQRHRFGLGLEDWESLLSPAQDQSLLRWISGDVDDTSLTLQQLLQSNQIDENAPTLFENPGQNQIFFPFPNPDQKQHFFNLPQAPEIQKGTFSDLGLRKDPFHDPGHQKPPAFNSHAPPRAAVRNLNPPRAAVRPPEPQRAAAHAPPSHHQQNQLICDQLLTAAELTQSGNLSHAQGILARLNHQLSSSAQVTKPFQRSAFYFKEALSTASSVNPNPNQFNGMFKMGSYKMFSEVSPVIQFANFTSNQAILEAVGDSNNIHIVDFDIGFGAQWASFIQELPTMNKNKNGNCSLKITAFASPSTHHPIELGLMHENLSQFAREIGVSFELEVVNFDSFDPRTFAVSGNETIAVNFPIWSASTHLSAIPSILHFIKQLSPRIVVSLDRGCERTDLPFPHYLLHGLQYYEVLFESIDGCNVVPDTSNKIERFLFQPQIENMVSGKLRAPEPMPHWRTLFTAGGYSHVLFSNFAEAQADCVVKRVEVRGFGIEKRPGSMVLCWQSRELMTVSAWKC